MIAWCRVIFITHFMIGPEISDGTVLRNGKMIGEYETSASQIELVSKMMERR